MKKFAIFALIAAMMMLAVSSVFAQGMMPEGLWPGFKGYKQAPMLSRKVALGQLPPIEGRLPKMPLVEYVFDGIGKYGGTWLVPETDTVTDGISQGWFRMAHFTDEWGPWAADSFKFNSDHTELTVHFREGLKWSDGQPWTTDDIRFWWEDNVKSEILPGSWSQLNKENEDIEFIDDYTIKLKFNRSRPRFLWDARGGWGRVGMPKHFWSQYHPKYSPVSGKDAVEQMKEMQAMNRIGGISLAVGPTLAPWVVVSAKQGQQILWERNAYYFGVDPLGNQLPYFDFVESFNLTDQDSETTKLKLLAGEGDYMLRNVALSDTPLFSERGPAQDLEVIFGRPKYAGVTIHFNATNVDADIAPTLNDPAFKKALSHAVDRQFLADSAWIGLAKPGQRWSWPVSKGAFVEGVDDLYLEFDLDLANSMLDEAGYRKGSDGFRTTKDGKKLTINVMVRPGWGGPNPGLVAESIVDTWQEVGVRTILDEQPAENWSNFMSDNTWIVWVQTADWPGMGMNNRWFANHAWNWAHNVSGGWQVPEKPTDPDVLKFTENENIFTSSIDEAAIMKAAEDNVELMKKNVWSLGVVQSVPTVQFLKNYILNAPVRYALPPAGNGVHEQWFRFQTWYFDNAARRNAPEPAMMR